MVYRDLCGGNITEFYLVPHKTGEKENFKPTLRHHIGEVHGNDARRPRFKMEVLKVFGEDALSRQVSKAVYIREMSGQMNRQQEGCYLGLLECRPYTSRMETAADSSMPQTGILRRL